MTPMVDFDNETYTFRLDAMSDAHLAASEPEASFGSCLDCGQTVPTEEMISRSCGVCYSIAHRNPAPAPVSFDAVFFPKF